MDHQLPPPSSITMNGQVQRPPLLPTPSSLMHVSTVVPVDLDIFDPPQLDSGSVPSEHPTEPWRENAISWPDILRFLYEGESQGGRATASCLALNKDISFLVDGQLFKAHSFVLQMKSGYFSRALKKLFAQAMTGKGQYVDRDGRMLWDIKPLPIPPGITNPESFKALLKFIYVEELDDGLSDEQLVRLVDTSKRFEVRLMEIRCKNMLGQRLNINNAMPIYEMAQRFRIVRLMDKCVEIMKASGPELFTRSDFLNISKDLLCRLLKSDELKVPEDQIFHGAIRWAREQLRRSGKPEDGQSLRNVLEPAHLHIRFPLLEKEFIVKEVPLGLLSEPELVELYFFCLSQNEERLEKFCSKRRAFQEENVASSQSEKVETGKESGSSSVPVLTEHNHSSPPNSSAVHQLSQSPRDSSSVKSLPLEPQLRLSTASTIDIMSISSGSDHDHEDGELKSQEGSPRVSIIGRMSSGRQQQNQGSPSETSQMNGKRKFPSGSSQEPAAKRGPAPVPVLSNDRLVRLNGNLDLVLTHDDVVDLFNVALEEQKIGGFDQVAKVVLFNILLPQRRSYLPKIIVPNIRHIEIVFDTTTVTTQPSIHPDDYLIFGTTPGVEVLLDSKLWNGLTRISLWENGIRLFEVNPVAHGIFVNVGDTHVASHIVKRLAVDIPEEDAVMKLALSNTSFPTKLNPAKLTHMVLHRCKLGRSDVFRDCYNLEKLSWIGIFSEDTLDLSHLSNVTSTLSTLSLCNITIKADKGQVPALKSLNTLHLHMCKWDNNFDAQLGIMAPSVRRLVITAYHNFMPSDAMASAFLTKMKAIENVVIMYAPPWVLNCAGRANEGARFIKFVEANANVSNSNWIKSCIPRQGFRLQRTGRDCWSFLKLLSVLPSSTSPSAANKEYFDYFLLQVFCRDATAYFRETQLKCIHSTCMGRYFSKGDILGLCLHEQALVDIVTCCRGSTQARTSPYSNVSLLLNTRHQEVSCSPRNAGCEQASVCGCSSCIESPPVSPDHVYHPSHYTVSAKSRRTRRISSSTSSSSVRSIPVVEPISGSKRTKRALRSGRGNTLSPVSSGSRFSPSDIDSSTDRSSPSDSCRASPLNVRHRSSSNIGDSSVTISSSSSDSDSTSSSSPSSPPTRSKSRRKAMFKATRSFSMSKSRSISPPFRITKPKLRRGVRNIGRVIDNLAVESDDSPSHRLSHHRLSTSDDDSPRVTRSRAAKSDPRCRLRSSRSANNKLRG